MRHTYRELVRHSMVYGLGQILSSLASFLLLPVYTRHLSPGDYGYIAILDLTAGVLGILIGSGISAALTRYHFDVEDEGVRDQVWWTGLSIVTLLASVLIVPAWLWREELAEWTLGPTGGRGGWYYSLVLPTIWCAALGQVLQTYLRVRKWSGLFVGFSVVRLLSNIALNVYFLVVLGRGVEGILLGNLLAGATMTLALLLLFVASRGRFAFARPLAGQLMAFGAPLVVTALLSLAMHQANRLFLRMFVGMDQVGIYSLACQIGQGVNSLYLLPFGMIWPVFAYEIAHRPDAKAIFVRVFEYFFYGLCLIMLGISLFIEAVLGWMVTADFIAAAALIPVVCLSYIFFSLHEHFRLPVMIAKKTKNLLPAFLLAAATNAVANLLLIPRMGITGAAWAGVLTFAVFSFSGLWLYRKTDRYPYPFGRCALVLVGMVVTYLGCESLASLRLQHPWLWFVPIACWIAWLAVLFAPLVVRSGLLKPLAAREVLSEVIEPV